MFQLQVPNGRNMIVTHQAKNAEVDNVFRAMKENDFAEAVLGHKLSAQFYEMLRPLQFHHNIKKSEEVSNTFRLEGNKYFKGRNLQQALIYYNKALMYAPENSLTLTSAYSNRSAIFLESQLPTACLNDVEKCLNMSCPEAIKTKLIKRKKDAKNLVQMEKFFNGFGRNKRKCDFFKFNVKRNPDIPCATADLEVIFEDNMPKVVAKNYIKVGTVIALETAFVSVPHQINRYQSCHYCNKMSLNLIPCLGCSHAIFCDEECRERCMKEYHSIECQIINAVYPTNSEPKIDMAFKATLKMKNQSKSWKEFIEASYKMGHERISESSINDIYDSNNPFSMLTFSTNQHFIYGQMYSAGALCAFIIKNLKELVPSYFPQSTEERNAAIRAFARVFLYLAVYSVKVYLALCVTNEESEKTSIDQNHFGLFSFCSKLKMSCHANALTVSLNKDLALVAMQPIPAGTEITIPFIENWQLADGTEMKNKLIFHIYDKLCDCNLSIEKKDDIIFGTELSDLQIETLKKLKVDLLNDNFERDNVKDIFKKVCSKMHIFSELPYTNSNIVYNLFRKCILHMQDIVCKNKVIGDDDD